MKNLLFIKLYFVSLTFVFGFEVGDQFNILREPVHRDHQHLQPTLNPWTVTDVSELIFSAESNGISGVFEYVWAERDNPFFDPTPLGNTPIDVTETEFFMDVEGNGWFSPPNIKVGQPTLAVHVVQGDDGTITTIPKDEDENEPKDNDDDSSELDDIIPDYSKKVDTDDDVPTLLSIRSSIYSLQQELADQESRTRGEIQITEGNQSTYNEVTLADIYGALTNDAEKQEIQEAQNQLESEESNAENELEDKANSFKNKAEEFANISITQAPAKPSGFTNLSLDVGSYNFYLDPFNDNIMGEKLLGVSWKDIADWISLIIGLVVVVWYWRAVLNMSKDVANTMIIANPTAPVTSLTIFGNSVGTVVMKIIKVGIMVTIIAGVLGNTALVLLESDFNMLGNEGTAPNIINALTDDIAGYDTTWTAFTVGLLFDFIPLVSITSMIVSYYSQRTIMWILMMIGYLSCKIST